jgi:hypothetical protein
LGILHCHAVAICWLQHPVCKEKLPLWPHYVYPSYLFWAPQDLPFLLTCQGQCGECSLMKDLHLFFEYLPWLPFPRAPEEEVQKWVVLLVRVEDLRSRCLSWL